MKIVDQYIGKTVIMAIGLVTLMLTGLQLFILFVNQLDDMGKANFSTLQALRFIVLSLPYQVYLFFPMAALLGCLIGLGVLGSHSELVVLRAFGMSVSDITKAMLKTVFVVIIAATVLGETIAPVMTHWAKERKIVALNGGAALVTAQGLWLRRENDFIHIETVLSTQELHQVTQFHFDQNYQLRFTRSIAKVLYEKNHWQAYQIAETDIEAARTHVRHRDTMPWDLSLNADRLKAIRIEPEEMTLQDLHRYIQDQREAHQNVHGYALAFWQRLFAPLTTLVMVILAIPFIFGPLRSSTMGSKLLVGATLGFGFYLFNRFMGPVSAVFLWPPFIAALLPPVLFALLGVYLMRRVR